MGSTRSYIAVIGVVVAVSGACAPGGFPGRGERLVVAKGDVDRSELRVPPGHMPNVGQCRVWFPGRPPGQQPKAGDCRGVQRAAPAGSWILFRPTSDKKVLHARVIDSKRAGVVVAVRIYDIQGAYLRNERPE